MPRWFTPSMLVLNETTQSYCYAIPHATHSHKKWNYDGGSGNLRITNWADIIR